MYRGSVHQMASTAPPAVIPKPQYIPLRKGDFAPRYLGRISDEATVLYLFIPFAQVFTQTAVAFSHRLSNSVRGTNTDEALALWAFIASEIKSYPAPNGKVGVRIGGAGGQIFDRVMADITIVPRKDQDLKPQVEVKDDSGNDIIIRPLSNRKEYKPKNVKKAGFLVRLILHSGNESWEDDDLTDLPPIAGEPGDDAMDDADDIEEDGKRGRRRRFNLSGPQKEAIKRRMERRVKRNPVYMIENLMTPAGKERFRTVGNARAPPGSRQWYVNLDRDSYLDFARRQIVTDDMNFDEVRNEHMFDEDAQARPEKIFSFKHACGAMVANGAHPEFVKQDNWAVHKLPAEGRFTVRINTKILEPRELARYLFPDVERPRLDRNSLQWKLAFDEIYNRLKSTRFEEGDDQNDTEEQKAEVDRELKQEAEEQTRIELETQFGTATEFNLTDLASLKKKISTDIRESQERAIASIRIPRRHDYGDDLAYARARQKCKQEMKEAVAWAKDKAIKRGLDDIAIFCNLDAALSKPQLTCRKHLDEMIAKKKHASIPFVRKMKNLTTFGEFMVSMVLRLEGLDGNYATHTFGVMLFLAHLTVFLPDAMKCNVLLAGDAMVGKSNIEQWLAAAGHPELFVNTQGGSDLAEKADNAVWLRDMITLIMEECPPKLMGLENNPGQRQNASKQQAQTDVAARLRAELTNPESSEWHRLVQNKDTGDFDMKSVGGKIRKVYILAMNILFSQIPDNMRSRILCLTMSTPTREGATLSQKAMGFKRTETMNMLRDGWTDRMKRIQDMCWKISVYLETNVLTIDNSATAYFVEEVARRGAIAGIPGITDIREHLRIDQLIRACVLMQVQLDTLDVVFEKNPELNAILLEKDFDEVKFIEAIRPLLRTRIEHAVFVLSGMVQVFEDPISWKVCDAIKRRFDTPFTAAAKKQFELRKKSRSGAFNPDAKQSGNNNGNNDPEAIEVEAMLEEYKDAEEKKLGQEAQEAVADAYEEEERERKQQGDAALFSGQGIRQHFITEEQKLLNEEDAIKLKDFIASYDQQASESRRSWMQCEKLTKEIYSYIESPKPTGDEVTRCLINLTRLLLPAGNNRGRMVPALRFQDTTCLISQSVLANSRRNPLVSIIYEVLCQDDMPKGRFVTLLPSRYCPWIMRTLCNDEKMMNSDAERELFKRVREHNKNDRMKSDGHLVYVNPCYYEPILFKILNNERGGDGKEEAKRQERLRNGNEAFDRDDWKARELGSNAIFNHRMPELPVVGVDDGKGEEEKSSQRSALMEAMDILNEGDSQPVMRMDDAAEDLFNTKNITRTLRLTGSLLETTVYKSPTKKVLLRPSRHHTKSLQATKAGCAYQYPDVFASRRTLQFRNDHTMRLADERFKRQYSMKRIRQRDAKEAGLDFLMDEEEDEKKEEKKKKKDSDQGGGNDDDDDGGDFPSPDDDKKDGDSGNMNMDTSSSSSQQGPGPLSSSNNSNRQPAAAAGNMSDTMSLGGELRDVKRNTGTKRKEPSPPSPPPGETKASGVQQLPFVCIGEEEGTSVGFLDIFADDEPARSEEDIRRLAEDAVEQIKKRKIESADGKVSSKTIVRKQQKQQEEETQKVKQEPLDSEDEDEDYTAADAEIDEDIDSIAREGGDGEEEEQEEQEDSKTLPLSKEAKKKNGGDDDDDDDVKMSELAKKIQKKALQAHTKGKSILRSAGKLLRDFPDDDFINIYDEDIDDDEEADGVNIIDLESIPDPTEEELAELEREEEEVSDDGRSMETSSKELKRERALAKKLRKEERRMLKEKEKEKEKERRKYKSKRIEVEEDDDDGEGDAMTDDKALATSNNNNSNNSA